jgi:methionyl-tRNA formyltransferase
MTRVAVLGTYNDTASRLFEVDLMRYLAAQGHAPSTVVFRTGSTPRPDVPLNTIHPIENGRSVVQVTDFNDPAAISVLNELGADLLVYAGGRDLLRGGVLGAARLGCLGGHYGPLPEIRGMGTVEWSLLTNRPIVVAIQRMSTGVDTGEIVLQAKVALAPNDSFTTIRSRCYYWTKMMLVMATRAVLHGTVTPTPQRLEDGEQYYRMHPDVLALATRTLADRLKLYGNHPWAHDRRVG